jgi:hypothetical protein
MRLRRWDLDLAMSKKLNKRSSTGSKGMLNQESERVNDDIVVDLYLDAYKDNLKLFRERLPSANGSLSDEERNDIVQAMKESVRHIEMFGEDDE